MGFFVTFASVGKFNSPKMIRGVYLPKNIVKIRKNKMEFFFKWNEKLRGQLVANLHFFYIIFAI